MRLSVVRRIGDFFQAEVAIKEYFAREDFFAAHHPEMVDQEIRAAELAAGFLNAPTNCFMNAADEMDARVAAKQAHVFVVDVCGKLARWLVGAIVWMRRAVPDFFTCVAHVISDGHLIASHVALGE